MYSKSCLLCANGKLKEITADLLQKTFEFRCVHSLSSAEASIFRTGWEMGEVKSKRAEPGEKGNESSRGDSPTEGASAEERGEVSGNQFRTNHKPEK